MRMVDHVVGAVTLAMIIVQSLTCPTTICKCSARGTVICSGKRLERIPYFAREPGRIYDEIDLSRNEIFAVPPYAFDSIRATSLLLTHNPLIGVSPRAFIGVGDVLERVDISDCRLPVLHWAEFYTGRCSASSPGSLTSTSPATVSSPFLEDCSSGSTPRAT